MDSTVKKYLAIGGTIALLGGGTYAFIQFRKKIKLKKEINATTSAATKATVKTLGINVNDIARQLGIELGTAYPSYDPRHWTENDETAEKLVLKVPKPLIPQLVKQYASIYKRNLKDDLIKLLDGWNNVSYLFN
jgi:hypothetical protein